MNKRELTVINGSKMGHFSVLNTDRKNMKKIKIKKDKKN